MRVEKKLIINEDGKDLPFTIKQMSATDGLTLALKVGKFFSQSLLTDASNVPQSVPSILLAMMGSLDIERYIEIRNDLLSCVTYTGGALGQVCTADTLDGILTNPMNVYKLLEESAKINLNFIYAAMPENLKTSINTAIAEAAHISKDSPKATK